VPNIDWSHNDGNMKKTLDARMMTPATSIRLHAIAFVAIGSVNNGDDITILPMRRHIEKLDKEMH